GIAAMGSEVDEIARLVLSEAGIESAHTPVHFSKVNISAFDEIHVMTLRHKTALCSYHKEDTGLEEKIHILGVEDPFGKAKEAYHECLEKLREFYETFING
ncbi:MAG: hypothetical protein FWE60_01890, partial [Oscillospiraceae bacterium]|nr:hypothetical protein [Oscillospiraceae bacterium]